MHVNDFALATKEEADAYAVVGGAFWSGLEAASPIKEQDRLFLKSVFNPHLSDRHEEGARFVPPQPTSAHLRKLHALVEQEQDVRQRRKEHFLSPNFTMSSAGPLFPASWTAKLEIAKGHGSAAPAAHLRARPEYVVEAPMLEQALETTSPVFDKKTEDGTRFRMYRLGSLEVRTTQEHDGKEVIGAVFSQVSADGKQGRGKVGPARVLKVTEYVERACESSKKCYRLFIMLETEQGGAILTEQLADGSIAWSENPADLEDRRSLAKVSRTADCRSAGVTSLELKSYLQQECDDAAVPCSGSVSHTARRRYSQAVFSRCLQLGVDAAASGPRAEAPAVQAEVESGTSSGDDERQRASRKLAKFQEVLRRNQER
jgi:hypothetical protein